MRYGFVALVTARQVSTERKLTMLATTCFIFKARKFCPLGEFLKGENRDTCSLSVGVQRMSS